jgi:hypothetical protein
LIAHAFDQRVEYVDAGAGVVKGAVGGLGGRSQQPRQRGQPDAGCLLAAQHSACQADCAQHRRTGPVDVALLGRGFEEPDVESRVVGHQHRAVGELQEHRQHCRDRWRVAHHRGVDPGEFDDLRRDRPLWVDQGGELADDLPAAHLDRADLGDRVTGSVRAGLCARAGGLEVDHHERGLG